MISILLKTFPYSVIIRFYYWYYKKKKSIFFNQLTTEKRYKNLNSLDLSPFKKSSKLFVIGSGYSLNFIKPENWAEIRKHDTLGFNFSFINKDHIPTFYTCEAMDQVALDRYGNHQNAEFFKKLFSERKEAYKDVIKFATDLEERKISFFEEYAREMIDQNFFICNTVNGVAGSEAKFRKLVRYYKRLGLFAKKTHVDELFKFRATLSMAISFGINMGYEEIILCGIDLNDPRYFYQDKTNYPDVPDFRSSPSGNTHITLKNRENLIAIDTVCNVIFKEICEERKIQVFIQNPSSALNKYFPSYSFENN